MADAEKTASGKILHNSFWFGLETIIETVVFFATSLAIARYFGPENLGHFNLINFFVLVITRTGGTGLAGATRKYMAEFLAIDRPGTAHAVYRLASKYQLLSISAICLAGLLAVRFFGEPGFHLMSYLLILSIVPGVMSWVPAQANQAFEDVSQNTFSALGYIFTYTAIIFLTLHFGWGLAGIAAAQLVGRTVEVVWRTIPLNRKLSRIPLDPLERPLVERIRRFCLQSIGIQLLISVVWDRSELLFIRHFNGYEQVGLYSVSFSLSNYLLLLPRTFGGATGITLMVESGRDPARIDSIVRNACRFLLLVAIPVHLGAAAIVGPAVRTLYGVKYVGAIPIVMVAAILALPRAFQEIAEVLLRAADRQRQILIWFGITGIVNIVLDYFLIKHFGAVGAAWANGLAQTFGIVAIWRQARRFYTFGFPILSAARLFACGLGMMAVAAYTVRLLPGLAGLLLSVVSAAVTYLVLVRLLHGLEPSDRLRLTPIGNRLPGPLRPLYQAAITFAAPTPKARPGVAV